MPMPMPLTYVYAARGDSSMPFTLPSKISGLTPYDPIAGDFAIRLDANESFLHNQPQIMKKAIENINLNRYPDPYCTRLCKAFAARYAMLPENIVMGNGSDELISIITGCLLQKGDTVVMMEMDFSMYRIYAELYECRVVTVPKCTDLTVNVDAVIDAAKHVKAKMVIFSNPCNPTSLLLPQSEVLRLIQALDCLVVVDEAYMDFTGDYSVIPFVRSTPHLLVLKTFSKAFGLAAIRLGVAITGQTLANALKAVKSPYNVNALSQAIGEAILTDDNMQADNIAMILLERDFLLQCITALAKQKPQINCVYESATNFIFIKIDNAVYVHQKLLEAGIVVRLVGTAYLRVTAGRRVENEQFLKVLEALL